MNKLNVISQLLGFFVLAIMLNQMRLKVLIFLFLILIVLLIATKTWQFLRTVKRFKWFFLVMMLIFAFNTPGQHVSFWPFSINPNLLTPTYEGLLAGAMQALRIICMLAVLSLILAINTKQQLISGFYFLLSPLQYLGLTVERFAARLWLTLHYVELQDSPLRNSKTQGEADQYPNKQSLISRLKNMADLKNVENTADLITIELNMPTFGVIDCLAITLLLLVVVKAFI